MPVAGRKPKPEGRKRNNHPPTHEWVEVLNVPFRGAPKLPPKLADGRPWPAATRQWWKVISSMPHCALWESADWQFAVDTAFVVAAFHGGDLRQAAEVRQREKLLGNTFDARRDLRIRYVADVQNEESAGVANLADYRAALG